MSQQSHQDLRESIPLTKRRVGAFHLLLTVSGPEASKDLPSEDYQSSSESGLPTIVLSQFSVERSSYYSCRSSTQTPPRFFGVS